MTPTPLDAKPQGAQLRKFEIEMEKGHVVDCCEYAEAAERIERLEREKQLHAGDTLSLSNELDEWKERAQDAERALADARRDAERYRWIRHADSATAEAMMIMDGLDGLNMLSEEQLDAAIDAARQPEKDANNG